MWPAQDDWDTKIDIQNDLDRHLAEFRPAAPSVTIGEPYLCESTAPDTSEQQPQKRKEKQRKGNWWTHGYFARFPYRLFGSGLGCKLGATAGWLLIALYDQANRHSSLRFRVSDRKLAANTGISQRTIIEARKRLVELGLIECSVAKGQSPLYVLKPIPEIDIPASERPRQKCKPRGRSAKILTPDLDDLWGELPQSLRGGSAKYARPYASSAPPSRFFNKG